MTKKKDVHRETLLASGGRDPENNFGIVNPPVYHASTVTSPTLAEWRARDFTKDITYGRMGTPTQKSLEDAVALVEGGDRAIAVASGLASITTAISAFVEAGDHILVSDSAYFPTRNFCNNAMAKYGVETTYYDPLIGPASRISCRTTPRWFSPKHPDPRPSKFRTFRPSPRRLMPAVRL